MLRLAGGQVESLLDELLPVEVRELPPELAVLDRLLADPRLLAPITQAWEQAARGHGRPTIPMTSFVRLMVVKQRTGWGYETLVREVSDSLHLRRFCLLPLTQRVPDESTVRKLVRRLGPEVVAELTRVVIGKAQRETRFRARAVRIDSTVVEADIRYPADGMLAWQGARVLAREGRKLAGRLRGPAVRVVDRSRRIGKLVRAIAKTLARRTGQRVEEVLALNAKAGQAMARSVREARALARQARAAARGRGARAKLRAAWRLEELADRCQRVATQIQQRSRGQRISNRLVSLSDPDARPIRKGKLGKPNEFGYVVQVAEVTANTRRGARGFVLPAATAPGNPGENRLLAQTAAELDRLGLRPREVALDGGLCPARPQRPSPGWRRRAPSSRGVPSRARGAPAGGWPATAPAARAASATSSAAMGCDAAACGATRASGSGPAGRSWPTTWTPSPSTPPDKTRIGGTSHHCAGRQADRPPHPHPFIRGK
jgi:transposase, IS5 family